MPSKNNDDERRWAQALAALSTGHASQLHREILQKTDNEPIHDIVKNEPHPPKRFVHEWFKTNFFAQEFQSIISSSYEKHKEHRISYLLDIEKSTSHLERRASDALQHCVTYGRAATQSLFYLNGGALVALPTVFAIFELDQANVEHITYAAISFALGLIMASLTTALGYFNFLNLTDQHYSWISIQYSRLENSYYPSTSEKDFLTWYNSLIAEEKRQPSLDRRNSWTLYGAIITAIIGILSFGFGVYYIMIATPTPTAT